MALIVIPSTAISYQALSTDISGSKITGANYIGASVFLIDTGAWMRVSDDLTLKPLYIPTGGNIFRADKEFTNLTSGSDTAYAAGDAITSGSHSSALIELSGVFRGDKGNANILSSQVSTNTRGIVPSLKLHLFNTSSGSYATDNNPWQIVYYDVLKEIGTITLPAMTSGCAAASNTSYSIYNTIQTPIVTSNATTSLYVGIETLTAFTPVASQKYTITLFIDNN